MALGEFVRGLDHVASIQIMHVEQDYLAGVRNLKYGWPSQLGRILANLVTGAGND